jgi:hypothetical protein
MYRLKKNYVPGFIKLKDKNEATPVTGCGTHRVVRH